MASCYKSKIGNSELNATFFSGVFPNTKGIKGEIIKNEIISNVKLSDTIKMPAFGTKIKGMIRVPEKGIYNFYFTCDDGGVLKLQINWLSITMASMLLL